MSAQPATLTESARTSRLVPIREADGKSTGRWKIQLIEADVQGSSGYYSADVLKRDGARAFPAGTHVFVDHPTESEEWERPERSVKDLAGYTVTEAVYEEGADGRGLFAIFQAFPNWADLVEAWKDHVGMSIRAMGLRDENGHVTELIRGESVDIVTRAGAGGRLVAMTESARQGKNEAPAVEHKPLYAELDDTTKQAMLTLNENMGSLAGVVQGLVDKIQVLEEKAAVVEQSDVLSAGQVFSKLNATDLPATVKTRLADGYKKGVDLDAQIAEWQSIIGEVKGADAPAEEPADEQGIVTESARGVGRVDAGTEPSEAAQASALITNIFGSVA